MTEAGNQQSADRATLPARHIVATYATRALLLLAGWLALTGGALSDLPAGVAAALSTAWVSLNLRPPAPANVRPLRLVAFSLLFFRQSVAAGLDVAWHALRPRPSLRPGFVLYQPLLKPGMTREAFCAVTSLLPGTLPAGAAGHNAIAVHCLDTSKPVVDQLRSEELRFCRILARGPNDD